MTLLAPLPHYKPAKQKLGVGERRRYLRQVKLFADATRFHVACHEASRRYGVGRVRKGLTAFFAEVDRTEVIKGGPCRTKEFGAEAAGVGPGLVSLVKSETAYGISGMSPKAQAEVEHRAWTLAGWKERLAFFTVTLGPEMKRLLWHVDGGWQRFSCRLHQELTRQLKKRGLIPWWLSVTEIQTARSRREGLTTPHLHIVLVNKHWSKRGGPWALTTKDFDELIWTAFKSAVGEVPEDEETKREWLKACGNTKRVKKDAGQYLAKYISKGGPEIEHWNEASRARGLRVNQWWHCSRPLKARADAHRPQLHGDFAWWAQCHASNLEALGLLRVWEKEPEDFMPGGLGICGLRRDGIEIAWRWWRNLEFDGSEEDQRFVPTFIKSGDWGDYRYKDRWPSLSGYVRVNGTGDKLSPWAGFVPPSDFDSDKAVSVMQDRIHSPLADVLKERLELVYREVDIAEPVFLRSGALREKVQLQLPIDTGSCGSGWDVSEGHSDDPYWDDPSWRGGPPR